MIPKRAEPWLTLVKPGIGKVVPSLAQVALGYKNIHDRMIENQRLEGFPTVNVPQKAAKVTATAFSVPMRTVLDAIEALAEAPFEELKTFQEPENPGKATGLRVEDFGFDTDEAFRKRANRAKACVYRARFGPATCLRMLTDMLAFNLPVNKALVLEGIEQCEALVNTLSKLEPMALCPACKGQGCDVCDFGLVCAGRVAEMPAEEITHV